MVALLWRPGLLAFNPIDTNQPTDSASAVGRQPWLLFHEGHSLRKLDSVCFWTLAEHVSVRVGGVARALLTAAG